ncbi:hypothetical protein [Arthrobacter sp. GCM10027362]
MVYQAELSSDIRELIDPAVHRASQNSDQPGWPRLPAIRRTTGEQVHD